MYICKILKAHSVDFFFLLRVLEVVVRGKGEINVLFLDSVRRTRNPFPPIHFPNISH